MVTKNNIHEYWHLFEAIKEGKTIQTLWDGYDGWEDNDSPDFSLPSERYRVKSEPVVKEVWVNVYDNGISGLDVDSQEDADLKNCGHRTAYLYTRLEDGVMVEQKLIPIEDGE